MKRYKSSEIEKINLNEGGIIGILWINDELDLRLRIDWCGQKDLQDNFDFENIKTSLTFSFATNIEFNFKFAPTQMKGMEITSFNYFLKEDGRYEIEITMDFQPIGFIKLFCNDFYFLIEENKEEPQ